MKILSWNVNSIRSLVKNIDLNYILDFNKIDIFCISETKLSHPDLFDIKKLDKDINKFKFRYYNTSTIRKGYSGTAIWSNIEPMNVYYGINKEEYDNEGRVIICEFNDYYLINVYTPNSGQDLKRLNHRVNEWDNHFWKYMNKLQKKKNIIITGDLNVARYEIDIHSPKTNLKSAGFTIEERDSFNKYLKKLNLIDTFREINNDKIKYSYWSYMRNSRAKNNGWRIDYFLISIGLKNNLVTSDIFDNILGSDHAPIFIELKI